MSFRCYDNSDVIATLIIKNFHLYLIQLRWQFFQNFVYGDVVYAQTWEVLALKNCIEPPKGRASPVRDTMVSDDTPMTKASQATVYLSPKMAVVLVLNKLNNFF